MKIETVQIVRDWPGDGGVQAVFEGDEFSLITENGTLIEGLLEAVLTNDDVAVTTRKRVNQVERELNNEAEANYFSAGYSAGYADAQDVANSIIEEQRAHWAAKVQTATESAGVLGFQEAKQWMLKKIDDQLADRLDGRARGERTLILGDFSNTELRLIRGFVNSFRREDRPQQG